MTDAIAEKMKTLDPFPILASPRRNVKFNRRWNDGFYPDAKEASIAAADWWLDETAKKEVCG